jgi:hypothetical protein
VSIDPHFERYVLAEFRLRERRARRRDELHGARLLAQKLHHGRHELLAHLRRVAHALPERFRAVAWLHHAHEADVTPPALTAAGLTTDEIAAIELFDASPAPSHSALRRARSLSAAPGRSGQLARVVARAALEDRLDGAQPSGETMTALRLLPDPGLVA